MEKNITKRTKKKILVVGHFGYKIDQIGGQTIKTRNVYNMLQSKQYLMGANYFDTQELRVGYKSIAKFVRKIIRTDLIIIIPANNNLKYLFPIIYLYSKIANKKIIMIAVGGYLDLFLKDKYIIKKMVSDIKIVMPQTESLCKRLIDETGLKNVETLHNFKLHNHKPVVDNKTTILRVVYLARIKRSKGYEAIFRLAKYLHERRMEDIVIDFYGPIEKEDFEHFHDHLENQNIVRYKGIVASDQVHKTLSEYDVMIFPTQYPGEGFPGTILDAYIAGIPVITTNWKDLPEFIEEGRTGYVYNIEKEDEMYGFVSSLHNNRELLNTMKLAAHDKSQEYSAEKAWEIIKKYI